MSHRPKGKFFVVIRDRDGLFLQRTIDPHVDRWTDSLQTASLFSAKSYANNAVLRRVDKEGTLTIKLVTKPPAGASRTTQEARTDMPTPKVVHKLWTAPEAPIRPQKGSDRVLLGDLLEQYNDEFHDDYDRDEDK